MSIVLSVRIMDLMQGAIRQVTDEANDANAVENRNPNARRGTKKLRVAAGETHHGRNLI
jgi:hypothetical protein